MKRINLIPPEFGSGKKALVESGLLVEALVGGVILILILLSMFLYSSFGLGYAKKRQQSIQEELNHANAQIASVENSDQSVTDQLKNVEDRIVILRKKEEQLSQLDGTKTKWSEVLSEFRQKTPEKIWIDKLVVERAKCQVIGGTYNNSTVSGFIAALNQSRYFTNASFVRTEASTLNKENVIFFQIVFELKNV